MATELTFAKTFLSLLDSKTPKISPDHVEDPRTYPGSSPYTLPRTPSQKPFSKPPSTTTTTTDATAPGSATATTTSASKKESDPALTITLRSPRNPAFDLTLASGITTSTSLAEIKERVAHETSIPLDKIKLLFGKKPVADSKLLREVLGLSPAAVIENGGVQGGVELGVMVLAGGAASFKMREQSQTQTVEEKKKGEEVQEKEEVEAPVAQGLSGKGVLETGQFWEDLRGYLQQRVRDEGVAGEAVGVFRGAWEGRS
ncbi:cell-cycle control medial ring component [Parachaetomium inaequale]|uniref:Cell-cycle control medial ring component n=1 Tax=Parachaetomium inaequale TaxID=2588326 RepID=A0AAN6PS35_9PEZI|nr:cell-cycle control medial ring component [Parachaetomium inaequale]